MDFTKSVTSGLTKQLIQAPGRFTWIKNVIRLCNLKSDFWYGNNLTTSNKVNLETTWLHLFSDSDLFRRDVVTYSLVTYYVLIFRVF